MLKLSSDLFHLLTAVVGLAAGYFLTVQSLKLELAAKAQRDDVARQERKLDRLEILMAETHVTKEQFFIFSQQVETRLARIDQHLTKTAR